MNIESFACLGDHTPEVWGPKAKGPDVIMYLTQKIIVYEKAEQTRNGHLAPHTTHDYTMFFQKSMHPWKHN
jgi:hypothetical protein